MKMTFKAWSRDDPEHHHTVRPVEKINNNYMLSHAEDNHIDWNGPFKAYGKIEDVKLGGNDYSVGFKFEKEELRNWLQKFVKAKPEAALRLLGEMQAEAMIALAQRPQEQKVEFFFEEEEEAS
jgi:hypothetical protein